ncbi:MAG TPA: radical SAM family heme chaperone HemW [Actinomycetota bacterium]|nr:radical SAM family heme chaperone HemW [Actinomycetota bacterium]
MKIFDAPTRAGFVGTRAQVDRRDDRPTQTGEWLADPGFGIYVHIPFCLHRCNYCDFNTYESMDELHVPYVDALVADIARWSGDIRPATSVFFGGGTPTLLDPVHLGRILSAVRDRFSIQPGAEITVEANPETVDERIFERLLDAGFNRVSIGVQSLAPTVLERLGRTHSAGVALDALRSAQRAGVNEVNADLIYGSPWETEAQWEQTLEGILEIETDHVSAYALTVEEGTPLATLVASGRAPQIDPDVQADRHEVAEQALGAAGFSRYEISNWARPHKASSHNVLYWSAGDYLGFGAGAHGHLSGRRSWNVRLPRDFIAAVDRGETVESGHEVLKGAGRAAEALVLGLRLASGVDRIAFEARFGTGYLNSVKSQLSDLAALGLVEVNDRIRLTGRGTALASEVACRLL